MKPSYAPLTFKKEPIAQTYSRESIYDSSLQEQYDHIKKKGLPVVIPKRPKTKTTYTKANELPFLEFQPSNQYMSRFLLADDDSGDKKGAKEDLAERLKSNRYMNYLYEARLRRETTFMNREYLEWKSFYSTSGPTIRWTGEVSYYGSYILFVMALRFTPEFFTSIFFKSGMYRSKGGRILILQFLEQIQNIRFVKPLYEQLESLAEIAPDKLEENPIYQSFLGKLTPGFTTVFPVIQGTMAIAQSFLRERDIPFSQLFMKNMPRLLASPTINYVTASLIVNLAGAQVPVMVCQLASSVLVQFLSGKITELTKVYFFADIDRYEREEKEMLARKEAEEERKQLLDLRKKYVEVGIVGKDIDDRIKMKFDWEGNFGKNIAKFQDGLYKAFKSRGKAVPMFGSTGFDLLALVWGTSTLSGFMMFMMSNDFSQYQFSTGEQINVRFLTDFLTNMLRSFRFFDNMFSIETLALPVVQKLRSDMIRIFTELMAGVLADMKTFTDKVSKKLFFTEGSYRTVSNLQKQSMFAYYFYTAMEKILETLSAISDPAFRLILENYLNLTIPVSQNIVSNMFLFSIEDSLAFFESMNLFFLDFGIMPLTTSEGHINFYNYMLRQCSKGNFTSPAPILYEPTTDQYSALKPGTVLGELFRFFSITIPQSFAGYREKLMLLALPTSRGTENTFLDVQLDKFPPSHREELINLWKQLGVFQKIPAIFNYFLDGVPEATLSNPEALRTLFIQKMNEPETKQLFQRLEITDDLKALIKPEMFIDFAAEYTKFLGNALINLNNNLKEGQTKYTIQDVLQGKLSRADMSFFSDFFAEEYSDYVQKITYKYAPLFTRFNGTFSHSYAFQTPTGIAFHNILVSKTEQPPAGYQVLSLPDFKKNVLDPSFFKVKIKTKQRGHYEVVDGKRKFIEKPTDPEIEREIEFDLPEREANQMYRAFDTASKMGYTIYYQQTNTAINTTESGKVASSINILADFETFFTQMVQNAIPLKEGESWPPPEEWKVRFFQEGAYMSPNTELFSGDMNVVQIGSETHFYYNWKKHKGISDFIYSSRHDMKLFELELARAYRNGELKGQYLDSYIQLMAAKRFNQASMTIARNNMTAKRYALQREYEQLALRTLDEIRMYQLFTGVLKQGGDSTLLSGDNTSGITMETVMWQIMSAIGPNGMFPDHLVAMYGSPGGKKTDAIIGNLDAAKKSQTIFQTPTYQTPSQFMDELNKPSGKSKITNFQRMIAYIIHGWFTKQQNGNSLYIADLNGKTSPDLDLLGPPETRKEDAIDILAFREKVKSSPNGKPITALTDNDDIIILLKILYLITDKEGNISISAFNTHITQIQSFKGDKDKINSYINTQMKPLVQRGEKKENFIDCFLKKNCISQESPKEFSMSVATHYLFQIGYYQDVLNLEERVRNGQGIKGFEIYDGKSPFFHTNSYENIGRFFFTNDGFMGFDFKVLERIFSDASEEQKAELEAWKSKILLKKQTLLGTLLKIPEGEAARTTIIDSLTSTLTEIKVPDKHWREAVKTAILGKIQSGSILASIFGDSSKQEENISLFLDKLESPDIVRRMIEDDDLNVLKGLLSKRMNKLREDERSSIVDLEQKEEKIASDFKAEETRLDNQKADILSRFDKLWKFFIDKKPIDTPLLSPIDTASSAAPSQPSDAAAAIGGPGQALQPPQRGPALASGIREDVSQDLTNKLARAEKMANIQRLRNELSQSQSQAQVEDLSLKLMYALFEMFGSDEGFMRSFGNPDMAQFAVDVGAFPEPLMLQPPTPQEVPNLNIPEFQACARYANDYQLVGAVEVVPMSDVGEGEMERYKGCRQQGHLVTTTKTIFGGIFDITKWAVGLGSAGLCTSAYSVLSGLYAASKCAFTGFGVFVCAPTAFVTGASTGAVSGAGYCKTAAEQAIALYLPKYITNNVINQSTLLTELNDPKNMSGASKMAVYERFFNSFEAVLNDPNAKKETVDNLRKNLKHLYTLLLVESKLSNNDPRASAPPFTETLFGSSFNKINDFNYYPYYKPSLDQVSFIKNLGKFDFSNIKNPEDLLEQIKDLKLDLDDGTLTVLFGQKYDSSIESRQPSYNIWYRIGESIKRLDDYDKKKEEQGEPKRNGNLFEVLTASSTLITRFFNGETQEFQELQTEIHDYNENEINRLRQEEEERERRRIDEERKNNRVFDISNFFSHIYTLIQNTTLEVIESSEDAIKQRPILIDETTFNGIFEKSTISSSGIGISGKLPVRVITGEWDENRLWVQKEGNKTKIPDEDRVIFRKIIYEDKKEFTTIGLKEKSSWVLWTYLDDSTRYSKIYDTLDYVSPNAQVQNFFGDDPYTHPYRIMDTEAGFFSKGREVDNPFTAGWLDSEKQNIQNRDWEIQRKIKKFIRGEQNLGFDESTNMQRHGNLPPFFVASDQSWTKKQSMYSRVLEKYYIHKTSTLRIGNENYTVHGWFLKEDLDTFAKLQPVDESGNPVSLLDATLGKKFKLNIMKNVGAPMMSLFAEENDSEKTKWFKSILLKMIFSTVNGSFSKFIQFEDVLNPVTNTLETRVILKTDSGKLGIKQRLDVAGNIETVANIRLAEIHAEEQRLRRESENRARAGLQDERDLEMITKETLDYIKTPLTSDNKVTVENSEIKIQSLLFQGLEDIDPSVIKKIVDGLLHLKLSQYYDSHNKNETADPEKRGDMIKDAPTLQIIGNRLINEAETAIPENFRLVLDTVNDNIIQIGEALLENETNREIKEIYTLLPEIPMRGGAGEILDEQNWNALFVPDPFDAVFPVIEISVYQTSVDYPDQLLNKYIAAPV